MPARPDHSGITAWRTPSRKVACSAALRAILVISAIAVSAGATLAAPPTLSRDEARRLPPAEVIQRVLAGLADGAVVAPADPGSADEPLSLVTLWTRPHATKFADVCERANVDVWFAPATPVTATASAPASVAGAAATHSYLVTGQPPSPEFFIGDPSDRKSPELEAACTQLAPDDPHFFKAHSPRDASIGAVVFYDAVQAAKAGAPAARACEKELKGCVASLAALDPNRIDSVAISIADGKHGIIFWCDVQAGGRSWRLALDGYYAVKRIGVTPEIVVVE